MGDSRGITLYWVSQNRGTIGWRYQETAWGFLDGMMGSLNSRGVDARWCRPHPRGFHWLIRDLIGAGVEWDGEWWVD